MPGLTSRRATPSERLNSTILLLMPTLSDTVFNFWRHPHLRALYPRYLVALHTVIRASVPLMREALQMTNSQYLTEPFGRPLADYLTNHIPEEDGHDQWLLDDLKQLGYPPEVACSHMPAPAAAALVGVQYYYIKHVNPCALLGYIAVLEGYPPSESLCRLGAEWTGYPISAFRTLRKHANLDPHHKRDLSAALDGMPLTEEQHALIRSSALLTVGYVNQLITSLNNEDPSTLLSGERGG